MPHRRRGLAIKSQALLSLTLYVIFFSVLLILARAMGISQLIYIWFLPLLILEHLNQEISRIQIALSRQEIAGTCLFIRQGSWPIGLGVFWLYYPTLANINYVFFAWTLSSLAAASIGVRAIWNERLQGWKLPIDWAWLKRGIKASLTLLIATLALRGMQTIDRYWLEAISNMEIVGAYMIFIGIAGTMLSLLDAGSFSYAYPRLLHLVKAKESREISRIVSTLFLTTFTLSTLFSITLFFLMPTLLHWIGKDLYLQEIDLFYWILIATIVNALGHVPHYALYAFGRDREIAIANAVGLAVFTFTMLVLSPSFGKISVPFSLCLGFLSTALWKARDYYSCAKSV